MGLGRFLQAEGLTFPYLNLDEPTDFTVTQKSALQAKFETLST